MILRAPVTGGGTFRILIGVPVTLFAARLIAGVLVVPTWAIFTPGIEMKLLCDQPETCLATKLIGTDYR